jgi:vacuolar-type H+-ATPase subunit I/STV1
MIKKSKSLRYILSKATFSSGSGMPIAFGLNVMVLPLFASYMVNHPLHAALLIGLIYTSVSIVRLFIIDVVEDRYGLNIRPDYILTRCWHIIHRPLLKGWCNLKH